MTSRQRPRNQSNKPAVPADQVQRDLERFAAALKASEKADEAARHRVREQQAAEAALSDARRALEQAVEGVRSAKASRRGVAEADAVWKATKARVIELETGVAPSWAPPAPVADDASVDEIDADQSTVEEVTADQAADGSADSAADDTTGE